RGKYARAAHLRKLQRQAADAARCAVNHDGLAALYTQHVISALQRRETDRGHRAGLLEAEPPRRPPHMLGGDSDVFGVEAALWVRKTERIDEVAGGESADARTHGRDGS